MPDISLSHSFTEWRLLRARTSFTENPVPDVHRQNNANATTSIYPSRCTLHNNHNMNKSSSGPRFPLNCELLPRVGCSAWIYQRIAWPGIGPGRGTRAIESVHRRTLRLLEGYVLVSRLTAPGDVDIWVILIKRFIDMILSATSTIRSCTAYSLTRSYAHPSCGPLVREAAHSKEYSDEGGDNLLTTTA